MMFNNIILIANTEYSNLGIGYIASSLKKEGYRVRILDSRSSDSRIKSEVKRINPLMIGFSVTNHFNTLDRFIDISVILRGQNISCHFTAGGHYASLNPEELFTFMPSLDSIVLFEGEYTIAELADCLRSGKDWKRIKGIAYHQKTRTVINEYRPLEKDLDKFPYPYRSDLRIFGLEVPSATLLAGRGCVHSCTFCNEGLFYRIPGGPVKRIRKPESVVKEMKTLHSRRSCLLYIFVDDDFPASSKWSKTFCEELTKQKLSGIVRWKIACRADEVKEESFKEMKKNGLFLVFLGLEDGTDSGLLKLDKQITASRNLESINILKKLEIGIEIGFLLFQPETTFETLNENLDFLEKICGDGYFPVTWLKLIPFYGTQVGTRLIEEGRLKRERGTWDYDFREKWLDDYYDFIDRNFGKWLWSNEGFENKAMWIKNSFLVYSCYYGNDGIYRKLSLQFRKCTSESNMFLIRTMRDLSLYYKSGEYLTDMYEKLDLYRSEIALKHDIYIKKARRIMDKLYVQSVRVACERLMLT